MPAPRQTFWSKRELRLLAKWHRQGMFDDEIGELLGRTEKAIKSKRKVLGLIKPVRYTPEELQFVREQHGRLPPLRMAEHLGRTLTSVYQVLGRQGLSKKQKPHPGLHAFIRAQHQLGWSDAEIAAAWSQEHPDDPLSRAWIGDIRVDRLGLPHNAFSAHRRAQIAAKTREQLAKAGLPNLAAVRVAAFRRFAIERGWPADLKPREVHILEAIYERGPMDRKQLCEAIGANWKGGHGTKGLTSNRTAEEGGSTYLSGLMKRGLLGVVKRASKQPGKGFSRDVYFIPLHVKRGVFANGVSN